MKEIIDLINRRVYVQITYERGNWYYVLYQLPSTKDIEFANSGECQDGDLWLDSNLINTDWYDQGFGSYEEALTRGLAKGEEMAAFIEASS